MTMKGKEIVLGILQNGPRTGYEINEVIQNRLNHFFDGTFGMIYPTLKKLEKDGLVIKKQITQTDKPNKNVYSITEEGQRVFSEELMKPTTPEVLKSDFLMRLYFSNQLDSAKIKQFLKEEISRKQSQLDDLESQLESWQNNGMTDMQKVTFDYGVIYYSSTLKFLKELLYQSDI
ncbi:PadR family transcriptional regulator [Leuconostoc litchii]|uniref:PadR family transcriptional regulator n=1 Tax=Leuconostoc litchii TaxID=1981069 RepID=A0A6P2CPY6_9LACO|nr:PadR family transcriptional regulator [Leuconostoc litchii]TYC46280.1 PadR family transcriptional regulator [Leuconostoc litchii]GMA69992.1 PadR family transcriptional regulator [Leuconostoc litchii]